MSLPPTSTEASPSRSASEALAQDSKSSVSLPSVKLVSLGAVLRLVGEDAREDVDDEAEEVDKALLGRARVALVEAEVAVVFDALLLVRERVLIPLVGRVIVPAFLATSSAEPLVASCERVVGAVVAAAAFLALRVAFEGEVAAACRFEGVEGAGVEDLDGAMAAGRSASWRRLDGGSVEVGKVVKAFSR